MPINTKTQRFEKAAKTYFQSEKKSAAIVFFWSLLTVVVSWFLFFKIAEPMEKGVVYPLASIGLVQFFAGVFIFFNTQKTAKNLSIGIQNNAIDFIRKEKTRMEKIMANFEKYKTVELLLFFLGFAFLIGGTFGSMGDFTLGTGVGLTIQSAFLLVIDLLAAYRGGLFLHEINMFLK